MVALSCIVVVCTVYALSLPAQTLACNMEEHTHTTECYDENNELICEKEEHTHNEDCNKQEEVNEQEEDVEDEPETINNDEQVSQESEEVTTTTTTETTSQPFDLNVNENNITAIKLTYLKDGAEKEVTPDQSVDTPDDLNMTFHLTYDYIKISELKSHGNQIVYQLPEQFRVGKTPSKQLLDDNNKPIGTITVDTSGLMKVTYNQDYLKQYTDENTQVDASVFANVQIKLSNLQNGSTTVTTPKGNIQLNYGTDYIQRYGNVSLTKDCTKEGSSDYIEYTLEVRAGAEGCKDLVVVDKFTQEKQLVTYEGITSQEKELDSQKNGNNPYEENRTSATAGKIYLTNALEDNSQQKIPDKITGSTTINEPGSFVWTIGNMSPNEVRTLKYFVRLKDTAGAINVNNPQHIKNKAIVYAKGNNQVFKKAETDKTFDPKLVYKMNKTVEQQAGENYIRDENGNYIIKYKLEFTSTSDSNYALKNFGFWDYLNRTDGALQSYVTYNQDSIELYQKKKGESNYTSLNKNQFDIYWADNSSGNYTKDWKNGNPYRFRVQGTDNNPLIVNPGDSYYVTYMITVKPEVYAVMQSNSVDIKNEFMVNSANACQKGGSLDGFIDNRKNTVPLNDYNWLNKSVGNKINEDTTITMSGKRYNETFNEVTDDSTFEVPKGSYKYNVTINKTHGQWDVTNATLEDTFSSGEMEYVGYAQIKPKDEVKGNDVNSVWVKIDGKSSFSMKLNQVGFKDNNYSYTIEYYAKPKNLNMVSKLNVTNTFKLSREVKRGDTTLNFDRVNSSSSVELVGDYDIQVSKSSWYYEKPKENAKYWKNGKLYWVIEVSGKGIKKGTKIIDCISSDRNLEDHFLHSNSSNNDDESSLVGIYLDDQNPTTKYKSIGDYEQSKQKENVGAYFDLEYKNGKFNNDASVDSNDYGRFTLTAKKDINLNQKKMYIVIQTRPKNLPKQYRKPFTFRNEVYKKDPGGNEEKINASDQKLYYGGDILKELGQVFTYDGSTVTNLVPGQDNGDVSKIATGLLNNTKGVYASWVFKLNHSGELNGTYRVLENIPEGMDLAYIRVKWRGPEACQHVNSKEIKGLDPNWNRIKHTYDGDGNENRNLETIYYVKDKQALIELGGFRGMKSDDRESVDVQVVCKVKDPEVLLGKQKEFTNHVVLQTVDGTNMNTANSSATINVDSLSKSGTPIETESKINYEIIANPLGQKLLTNSVDKLTLIDELGENLILDSSIQAINIDTNEVVNISTKQNGNVLEIEIPDETPVKITYSTMVNVQPNTPVDVNNNVYWKSYKENIIRNNIDFTYRIDAGGSGSVSANPELKIQKYDSDNSSKNLGGVKFTVTECDLQNGEINPIRNSVNITSSNDVLTIPSSQFKMEYNTIYEVKETSTVEGYILDEKPYYIMYAKLIDNNYPDIVDEFNAYIEKQQDKERYKIVYRTDLFRLNIPNAQKGITVQKAFTNNAAETEHNPVSGTYRFGLYDNAEGTGDPLQTIEIEYGPNDTGVKSAKFRNPDNLGGTYYVFEIGQNNQPIKASDNEATINSMQYKVDYENNKVTTNSAKVGDKVIVTNKSRTKILPSTGSIGTLIYRLLGATLVVASLICLSNINKNNRKEKRRKR